MQAFALINALGVFCFIAMGLFKWLLASNVVLIAALRLVEGASDSRLGVPVCESGSALAD